MKIFNYIIKILADATLDLVRPLVNKHKLLNQLAVSMLLLSIIISTAAADKAIIFKGQSVKFKRIPSSDEFYGQINGRDVIATMHYNKFKNNHYLGAFRRLKRNNNNQSEKKLATYHVFEKS